MPDRVEIVHPNGTRATIPERALPGWRRLGWLPAAAAAKKKTPAPVPVKTDGLAAGPSSTPTEGAQP